MSTLVIDDVAFDDPLAQRLIAEVQQEYVVRYGGPDDAPIDGAEFAPPDGAFVIARLGEETIGCAGLRRHDGDVVEVKRMFVRAEHRRKGHARAMLHALEERARRGGYRRIVLETGLVQPEAMALYSSEGYQPIEGFGHYKDEPLSRSYAKDIVADASVRGEAGLASAEALRRHLDGRWGDVRDWSRRDMPLDWFAPVADLDTETHRARIYDQALVLARTGRPRLGFQQAYGGLDDIGGSLTSIEMLGYADLSLMVKAGVQWGLFGGAVQALGTESHHRRYLGDIIALDLPGCFAMTETGHGSDVASLDTTATYDVASREFVVHTPDDSARKDYIGNAARDGRLAVVFAQLVTPGRRHGVHALLVPIRDESGRPSPGVRIEDCGRKGGLNGVDNGRLWFDQVRVPRDALLDRYGSVAEDGTYSSPIESDSRRFFTMLGALVRGRVSIGGAAGSATKLALAIAIGYGDSRRQFRAPGRADEVVLLDYLAHQRKLLPALATSYALHFAQGDLVAELHDVQSGGTDDETRQRRLESRAAGMKAVTTWHASNTIQTCREACGGAGYLSENRLTQLKADTDVFTTFEGDNTVLLQLVAKGMLTRYRADFGDLDTLGTVRFLAEQAAEVVLERTSARGLWQRLVSAAPGRGDESDLRNRAWHVSLFDWRERHSLDGLARRLRKATSGGGDPFDAVNAAQPHLLHVARAHVHRTVLESFVAAIAGCPDPDVARLLDRVCDLYALGELESDRAWFLEHGRLTPGLAKSVTRTVDELCGELRPHAALLVAGFGIPAPWVGAALLDQ